MNLSGMIHQLISLFLMMLTGYIVGRTSVVTPDFRKKLSTFTLNTASPCVILSSVLQSENAGSAMLGAVGMAVLFYALMIAFAFSIVRLTRSPKGQRGLDSLMLIFTNIGFMGIPVVQSVYGTTGVAMVSMFILVFNLLFFSFGVLLISSSAKLNWRSLLNACIFAALLGLVFALTGWRLPAPVEDTLSTIGSMNTPLAMIVIGASLAHSNIRSALTSRRMYRICFLSMAVMPLLILAVVRLMPVDPMLAGVCVILAAMPIAGNCAMLSDIYTPDDMTASQCVLVSTLVSGVSLPLICMLIAACL